MSRNISVIIPAYNAEATLAETLDSVMEQTLKPDEIIVVNDGSTDATEHIAMAHAVKPRLINNVHQGASTAINTGISKASGDVLAFIDSDDLWERNKLQLQYEELNKQDSQCVIFSHVEAFICPTVDKLRANNLHFIKGPQPGFLVGTLFCNHKVFDRYGVMDTTLSTGYFIDWFGHAKTQGMKFIMLPDVLLRRRVRHGTLSQRAGHSGNLSSDFVQIARRSILRKRSMRESND